MEDKIPFRFTLTFESGGSKTFESFSSEDAVHDTLSCIESSASGRMSVRAEFPLPPDGQKSQVVLDYPPGGRFLPAASIYHAVCQLFTEGPYMDVVRFDAPVVRSGNSLVVRVSSACKMMGIAENDVVDVTMRYVPPWKRSLANAFRRNPGRRIVIDELLPVEGSSRELAVEFVKSHRLVRMMNLESLGTSEEMLVLDHLFGFIDSDGNRMLVSQPYAGDAPVESIRQWAKDNGCSVEVHPSMSWYRPGETTLIIIRPPEERCPAEGSSGGGRTSSPTLRRASSNASRRSTSEGRTRTGDVPRSAPCAASL